MKRALLLTAAGIVILGIGIVLGSGRLWHHSQTAENESMSATALEGFTEAGATKAFAAPPAGSTAVSAPPASPAATSATPAPPMTAGTASPAPVAPVDPMIAKEKAYTDAMALAAGDKLIEARIALTGLILDTPEDIPYRQKVKAALDDLNKKLFFSNKMPTPDSIIYTVAAGDNLSDISTAQKSSPELIMLVNGLGRTIIHANDRLKIPQGTFSVIVDKKQFRLIMLLNGQFIKEYQVAVGKDGSTPSVEFEIRSGGMTKNPIWTAKDGKVYPFGDPQNPLGTRWIGFKTVNGYSGFGIHGTTDPDTIGTEASDGCVRMRNQDVEEVFSMLRAGDKVLIR